MKTLEETINFAKAAHEGQTDAGGFPYHEHLFRVCMRVHDLIKRYDITIDPDDIAHIEQAAILHDVIEDTPTSANDLLQAGFSVRTVALVQGLSRPTGLTYMEWITNISTSGDIGLILIKLADNRDNADPDRIAQLPPEKRSIIKRYEKAYNRLITGLWSNAK